MDPKNRRAYTGRSGQLAVMAELLDRGCNVALPEVDVGTDLFAFQDEEAGVTHLQVKTARQTKILTGAGKYRAQIDVPLQQLKLPDMPPLYYVFAVRLMGRWVDFLVMGRHRLNSLRVQEDMGTEYTDKKTNKAYLKLTFSFTPDDVACSGKSLHDSRNAWTVLPPLHPGAALAPDTDQLGNQPPA